MTKNIEFLPNSLSEFGVLVAFSKKHANSSTTADFEKTLFELKNLGNTKK